MKDSSISHLAYYLANDVRYSRALSEVSYGSDCEYLAEAFLRLSIPAGTTLRIIRGLIRHELIKFKDSPQNIFRGNTLTSKILGAYVRRVGKDYMDMVLGDLIRQLAYDEELSLEIDPGKLRDEEDPEAIVEKNRIALRSWVKSFIDRITDETIAAKMPIEVRVVAAFIAQYSEELGLNTPVLVGGYIMLRFFNPAIATPEIYGLIDRQRKSRKALRNLILVSKILQSMSNGVEFGEKEEYMVCMNGLVQDLTIPMHDYITSLVKSEDLPSIPEDGAGALLYVDLLPVDDVYAMHAMLWNNAPAIITILQNESESDGLSPSQIISSATTFLSLLEETGPPDITSNKIDESFIEHLNNTTTAGWDNLHALRSQLRVPDLVTQRFLYRGTHHAQDGKRMLYLIGSRCYADLLRYPNQLAAHVVHTIGDLVHEPFYFIIDMSFCYIKEETVNSILKVLEKIFRLFPPNLLATNLYDVQVIHDVHRSAIYHLCRHFKSILGGRRRPRMTDHWEDLVSLLPYEHIALPEETKMFVGDTVRAVKVNAKGKRQDRSIKLTWNSILNIDPKTNTIKNERLLYEIQEISCPPDSLEVNIRFQPEFIREQSGFFSALRSKSDDLLFRKYICRNSDQRDELMESIFETTVISPSISQQQVFEVEVILSATKSKRFERILKFTRDSILFIDRRIIRDEIPFIAIDSITSPSPQSYSAALHIRGDPVQRVILSAFVTDFVASVKAGMARSRELLQGRSVYGWEGVDA
eukprot:gb/GECH01000703.1/.p1 GENE.gb/GECH01000703.1/~~gb/GECH01000703.1/.p1  ORF type:complete len:754 (+),score=170.42 gb/GECH01000703.1/:1-2262(+)